MISSEHRKHAKLARPATGIFGRNEWAILGAPCNDIKLLAENIISAMSPQYNCAYADASHDDDAGGPTGRLAKGAVLEYTKHTDFHQFNSKNERNKASFLHQFATADLILANGNHHAAKAQVVIIQNIKRESLQKRIAQLTNVELILLADTDVVFDFLKEAVPHWQQIPVYRLGETDKIVSFFRHKMQENKPLLKGLVLAGGKSLRMGADKGAIIWHNKEQRYYIADLLNQYCTDVFISCRDDQQALAISPEYKTLPDEFIDLGPYGAILSAFRAQPDSAWLVVACDLPLLDEEALSQLVANRNSSATATAFKSGFDEFPEPLITIWEPKSYPVLLAYLAQGYSCPRKVLINTDTQIIKAVNPNALTNVNTPADFERIQQQLNKKYQL